MVNKQYSSKMIMMITIAVAIVLVLVILPLSMMGKGSTSAGDSDDAESRIMPVARVEMQKAVAKSDGKPRTGEAIYNAVCTACHAAGVAGAPKTGDKAAWAPRIATGDKAMLAVAASGRGAMPPKGGAADLSDDELKAAVDYLVGKAK